jgi:arylformamidase
MNFIDLSHVINGQTPVYPGKDNPTVLKTSSIQDDGYLETKLIFDTHLGTHLDAPAHMLEGGRFLGNYPLSRFTGKAMVIKVPEGEKSISAKFLEQFKSDFEPVDFILFNTGWSQYWGEESYYYGFPVLEEGAVDWLTSFFIKGIGVDAISVDPVGGKNWNNHHLFFCQDIIIIENLIFPDNIDNLAGELFCFPLSIEEADGSPVRAVLKID